MNPTGLAYLLVFFSTLKSREHQGAAVKNFLAAVNKFWLEMAAIYYLGCGKE